MKEKSCSGTILRAGQSPKRGSLTEDGLYEVLMQSREANSEEAFKRGQADAKEHPQTRTVRCG